MIFFLKLPSLIMEMLKKTRWKGENVSTMEVEAAIIRAAKLSDCTVYGVAVSLLNISQDIS